MSNFSKVKEYAIVIDSKKGPVIKRVEKKEIDSFTHDIVEGYFEALPVNDISTYNNLILLVNDEGRLNDLQLNPWATLIFGKNKPITSSLYIFGNAVLFRKNGVELELFTKEEASDIVLTMRR